MSPVRTLPEPAADDWRELAARENDGLEIRLVWSKATGRVRVSVLDAKDGDSFELDVRRADALSAFYHPFAYATAAPASAASALLAHERSAAR
jgi:hypothetical protein